MPREESLSKSFDTFRQNYLLFIHETFAVRFVVICVYQKNETLKNVCSGRILENIIRFLDAIE